MKQTKFIKSYALLAVVLVMLTSLILTSCSFSSLAADMNNSAGEKNEGDFAESSVNDDVVANLSLNKSSLSNIPEGKVEKNESSESPNIHSHFFVVKDTSDKYLRTPATCASQATYYYSCVCGKSGASFFRYGNLNADVHSGNTNDCYTYENNKQHTKISFCSDCRVAFSPESTNHTFGISGLCTKCSAPGLYDEQNNLIVSWDVLTSKYGLDVQRDYYLEPTLNKHYKTYESSLYCILEKNPILKKGTKLVIDSSVSYIGDLALAGTHLTHVVILDGVSSIGGNAFYQCFNLLSVTIPNSVKRCEIGAFVSCRNLGAVYYEGYLEDWLFITFETGGSNPCYNGADLYFNGTIVTDVTISKASVYKHAFDGCRSLTNVTLSEGTTKIEACAFRNCVNLEFITFAGTAKQWTRYVSLGNRWDENAGLNTNLGDYQLMFFNEE